MGVKIRREEGYYHRLLANKSNGINNNESDEVSASNGTNEDVKSSHEKWKGQIEKVSCMHMFFEFLLFIEQPCS